MRPCRYDAVGDLLPEAGLPAVAGVEVQGLGVAGELGEACHGLLADRLGHAALGADLESFHWVHAFAPFQIVWGYVVWRDMAAHRSAESGLWAGPDAAP